jgi:hypothetical protein
MKCCGVLNLPIKFKETPEAYVIIDLPPVKLIKHTLPLTPQDLRS